MILFLTTNFLALLVCNLVVFIYLFTHRHFSATLTTWRRMKGNRLMMNWRECERNRGWHNLRYYPLICLEWLRKNTKNLNHDNQSPVRDLNPGPSEYKVWVLTTQLRRPMSSYRRSKFRSRYQLISLKLLMIFLRPSKLTGLPIWWLNEGHHDHILPHPFLFIVH
jgi:hypothetical protein